MPLRVDFGRSRVYVSVQLALVSFVLVCCYLMEMVFGQQMAFLIK